MPSSPLLRSRRRWATLVWFLAASGAVGCNCGTKALQSHAPKIEVDPNPVNVNDATAGKVDQVILSVKNQGTADLVIEQTPAIMNASSGIMFDVTAIFTKDCTGAARTGDLNTFQPGACAQIALRYLPSMDGMFTATLRFVSNDGKNSPLDVPITIDALTPHIKACGLDGSTMLGCNTDGLPLGLDFGSTATAVGKSDTRTIQLDSDGTKAVIISSATLSGDPDFSIMPGPQTFNGASIAPQAMSSVTVTFTPIVGGPRTGKLVFATNDPKNPTLTINFSAKGDGPALCYCIGTSPTSCENTMPTMNFGQVGLNTPSTLNLYLNDCGTEPLTFTGSTPPASGSAFAAMDMPAANTVLGTGMTLTIPVTFTPTAVMPYTGSVEFQTEGAGNPIITLEGSGAHTGCNLQPEAMSIDFGQVAGGQTATQEFVVANTGTQPCYFPMAPAITMESTAGLFNVATYPLQALAPSHTAQIGVTYTPKTTSGTDTGTMTIYYAGAASGAMTMSIPVALKGEPVATATCKLFTNPNATSMFGGALNFGDVGINRSKSLPVVIRNIGSATCTLGKASVVPGIFDSLPGGGFGPSSAFTITGQPLTTLAPGATTTITVSFLPTAEEQYGSPFGMIGLNFGGASVQIQTSDTATFNGSACGGITGAGSAGCAAWGLSGQGVTSTIAVLPDHLDFGEITLGCNSPTKNIAIYNVGNSDIHIFGFTLDPAPPPTIFTVIAPPASMSSPITIHAGNSINIQVKYTPSMMGIESATLYINSDAVAGGTSSSGMSNPYVSVGLLGTGVTTSQQTDTFTQLDHQVVDVLWVIDMDSDSMAAKQQAIATNSQAFIQAAQAANTDYHLGVISNYLGKTETSNNSGKTITPAVLYNVSAPQLWVQPSDSNPVMEFAQNAMIGVTSDATGSETGLEAMYRALSDPIISTQNKGFLRDNARLVVISISDDDDFSSKSPTFYAAFLQSLKPSDPQGVVFDTVGGEQPSGCTNGVDGDSPDRFMAVSNATGGKLYDICTGAYNQIAADLSLGSFGGQTHFVLSRPCDPSTLTVTVTDSSGNTTMQTMGTDYTFNATLNSIDFATSSIPPPNSTITATYDALCL